MELTLIIGVLNPYTLCACTIICRRMVGKSTIYSHVLKVAVTTAFSITRFNDKQSTKNHVTFLKYRQMEEEASSKCRSVRKNVYCLFIK